MLGPAASSTAARERYVAKINQWDDSGNPGRCDASAPTLAQDPSRQRRQPRRRAKALVMESPRS